MIKNVFTAYVLPLFLSGTSFLMPKDTNIQLYIGYACYIAAIIIFGFSLFKNYGRKFTEKAYNLINKPLNNPIMRFRSKIQNQPKVAQLSSEIDECLWYLKQFERNYQRTKNGFNRPEDFSEIARTELERSEVLPAEFRLSLPNWHQITIEQYSVFDLLPKKKARQVELFYQRLNDIEKLHTQIKKIVKKEKSDIQPFDDIKQFEKLTRLVLDQSNPLKSA